MGAGGGVHIYVFIVALLVGFHDVVQAHGVVQACLDMAGALGRCAVQIGDPQGQGLYAALEVGADRRGENTELVNVRGLDANDGVNAEHKGTDVQRSAGTVGRDIGGVGAHGLHDGLHKPILREYGHPHPAAGVSHPGGVQVGAEADDVAVGRGVGLQPLKAGLGVLQNTCALVHLNGGVGGQAARVPLTVFEIGHKALLGLHVAKSQIAPVDIFLFHRETTFLIIKRYSTTANVNGQ